MSQPKNQTYFGSIVAAFDALLERGQALAADLQQFGEGDTGLLIEALSDPPNIPQALEVMARIANVSATWELEARAAL